MVVCSWNRAQRAGHSAPIARRATRCQSLSVASLAAATAPSERNGGQNLFKVIVFTALTLGNALGSVPAVANNAADKQRIIASFSKLKEGFVQRDAKIVREVMTPDGILTTPFYRAPFSVDEVVSRLEIFDIKSHATHELKIEIIDRETALMTLFTSFEGTFDGTPLPPWVFASAVWTKDGEEWRVKSYQETAVDAPR